MTDVECLALLRLVKIEYPEDMRLTDKELLEKSVLWAQVLAPYTLEQATQGLHAYMRMQSANYAAHAPKVGQIIDCIVRLDSKQELNPLEAWALVSKAIRNSNYHSEEEFDALPAIVQKAVGSPATLREWAAMDSNTVHSVEQSNFMRTFEAVSKRAKDDLKLPPEYRLQIEQQQTAPLMIETEKSDRSMPPAWIDERLEQLRQEIKGGDS